VGQFGDAPTIRVRKSRFRGLDTESALELLAILNAAERLDHISPLKSVGLHPQRLTGYGIIVPRRKIFPIFVGRGAPLCAMSPYGPTSSRSLPSLDGYDLWT